MFNRYYTHHEVNLLEGTYQPSTQKNYNNAVFLFWERALFQRAAYCIKANVPFDAGVRDFMIYCLFRRGFVACYNDDKRGFVFQPCNLGGYDFYYQPVYAIVTNPAYNGDSKTLHIGHSVKGVDEAQVYNGDCEILKLTPDYMGIWDIINYHAEKLALLDNAINMSIINNKFAFLLGAKSRGAAQALKKIFDKLNSGDTTVVYDQRIFDEEKEDPFQFIERTALKQNYLTTDQLRDFQTILNSFDTQVGIQTAPIEKKERITEFEGESKQVESEARVTIWVETLNESAKIINNVFGVDMHFEVRKPDAPKMQEGGSESESE